MKVFELIEKYGHEQVVLCHDKTSGLRAVIAIHDTTLGPALGGCRMWPYASEDEAIIDALRLSRGMTYKSAAAGLDLGGGKSVIMADPRKDKTEELLRAFGRCVESLGGRYITAEDVGTSVADMEVIARETKYITGLSDSSGSSGDPSPVTAFGVWQGMKAAAKEAFGTDSLTGRTVAIQGLGHVGYYLAKHLAEEGAKLIVTDIFPEPVQRAVEEFGATPVAPDAIYGVEADIFAPCALGAIINDDTIPQLKVKVIAGAANNQLAEERHGAMLHELGILYAPDYVINAGGVINVADELKGYNRERALKKAAGIYQNIEKVIAISKRDDIPTYLAADRMAEERIARVGKIRQTYMPR